MSDIPTNIGDRRRPPRRWSIGLTIAAIVAIGAFIFASSSSADPVYDPNKVVPNAAGMSADYDGNSNEDCRTGAFLAQDQDLWHFVVAPDNVSNGGSYKLTADITAVIIKWVGDGLVRYTGTDDYDQGNAGPNLFWAYTEPGRTIEQAWLEYTVIRDDGQPAAETFLGSPHNLSHACAADGGGNEPPTIVIDSETHYDMLYDLVYDWNIDKSVDPSGLVASGNDPYILNYSVTATRVEPGVPGNYRIIDGSMVSKGTAAVTNAGIGDIVVTSPNADCIVTEDANPADDNYLWQCVYIVEPPVTSASGISGTGAPISGTVTTDAGTDTDTEIIPWLAPDTLTLAGVIHATAYIKDGDRRTEASSGPLSLTYTIEWLPTQCPDRRINVAELFDGVTDEPLGIDDTLTISGCPPVPGRTIGYWGNNAGAPQVVAAFPTLRVQYPALAAIPITNEASVRNYLRNANCSGECTTMFLAQALGTVMNANVGSFGDQSVYFAGECRTVDVWLDLALRTAIPIDRETRIAFKSLFDDLNNTRAARCASVS